MSVKKELRYEIETKTSCWIVKSHRPNGEGYFYMFREGERDLIHRWIYCDEHGSIPKFHEVRHACGKKACINPEHLYLYENKRNPSFYRNKRK